MNESKQRNRKLAKEDFRQKLVDWHLTKRERLFRTNIGETYDQKWDSFLPNRCFNVDQSPMAFAINMKWTYHLYEPGQDQNQEKVWISQPGCGFEKRQCTLQMFSSWRKATKDRYVLIHQHFVVQLFQKKEQAYT